MCASILPAISLRRGKVATMNARPRKIGFRTLPDATVKELCARAERIRNALRRSLVEVGQELIEAKALISHGHFVDWLGEVGMALRTAERVMAAAKLLLKNDKLSDLPKSALYLLAAPAVTAAMHEEVACLVEQDARPSVMAVRDMIAAAKRPAITVKEAPREATFIDLHVVHDAAEQRVISLSVASAHDSGGNPVTAGGRQLRPLGEILREDARKEFDRWKAKHLSQHDLALVTDIARIISGGLPDPDTRRQLITLCRRVLAYGDLADAIEKL
jgi:hypothetical protein